MDYSNNIWRKILTILMIVNLCFILFAKITKSFGAYSVTYDNIEIPITDNFLNNSPYFCIFASDTLYYGNHAFWVVRSNSPIKLRVSSSGSTRLIAFNTEQNGIDMHLEIGGIVNYMNNTNFTLPSNTTRYLSASGYNTDWTCVLTNHDLVNIDNSNEVLYPDNTFNAPHFDNLTEIENGYPDGVFISRGDYSENDTLYFHLLKITNTVPDGNQSTYYYDSKVFKLTKDSKYYKTYDSDTDNKYSYYYIERSALTLDTNSSYLYVLSNSGDSITNSYGILQPDIPGGIYDVVESDTAGVITEQQSLNDKIANINNNQQEIANNSNNINSYLNENTISNDTNENIDTNLNFNNQNANLNNLNNGFFTRLTTMLSNISNYDLQEDTVVNIPLPNSQKHLELHSNIFYNNITGSLRTIINAFWTFIFTFYLWKFINKIYIAVSSGSILDNFSSSGETITNDML